jgi:hypothetical protein
LLGGAGGGDCFPEFLFPGFQVRCGVEDQIGPILVQVGERAVVRRVHRVFTRFGFDLDGVEVAGDEFDLESCYVVPTGAGGAVLVPLSMVLV